MSKLPPDPVIDEIREIRHRISERCGHDPKRLYEYYLRRQEEYRKRKRKALGERNEKSGQ